MGDGTVLVPDGAGGTVVGRAPAGPFGTEAGFSYAGAATVTSTHSVGTAVVGMAPGGNYGGSGSGWGDPLSCGSCHDPHGGSHNYRSLVGTRLDSSSIVVVAYAETVAGSGERVNYDYGMTSFCTACHVDFNAGAGSGSSPPSEVYSSTAGSYRHPVGVSPASRGLQTALPLEGTAGDSTDSITCVTCHFAHGTTAAGTSPSGYDQDGDGTVTDRDVTTALKRADNMGVCEDCHRK